MPSQCAHVIDKEDRYFEPASRAGDRLDRILWIGRRMASSDKWLTWDNEARQFSVSEKYDVVFEGLRDSNVDVPGKDMEPVSLWMQGFDYSRP